MKALGLSIAKKRILFKFLQLFLVYKQLDYAALYIYMIQLVASKLTYALTIEVQKLNGWIDLL